MMKKFVKYTAITALVLVVVGTVLLSIGAIGGSVQGIKTIDVVMDKIKAGELNIGPEDFKQLEELLKDAGTSVEEVLEELDDMGVDIEEWLDDLGIEAQYSVNADIKFVDGFEIFSGGSVDLTFEADEVDDLYVSLAGSNIEFVKSTDDKFHVKADHVGKFQAFVSNETFHIIGSKTGANITLADIVVEIPANTYFENAQLDMGAGSIVMDYLGAGEAVVSVGAGDFAVDYLDASEFAVSVGAGEASVLDGTIGKVKADVGAGSIDITAKVTGNVDADVAMGDITLFVKGSTQADHNYNVDCAMGEIVVGSNSWAGLAASDVKINNEAESTYDLDCAMGSLIVKFME